MNYLNLYDLKDVDRYSPLIESILVNKNALVACSYYTASYFNKSSDYQFANSPLFPSCSSKKRLENASPNTVYPCVVSDLSSEVAQCPYSKLDICIVDSKYYGSDFFSSQQIDLIRSRNPIYGWNYYIYNSTTFVIYEDIHIPYFSENSFIEQIEADQNAKDLFNNFLLNLFPSDLTSYKEIAQKPVFEESKKNSFLLSLISTE